TDWRESPAVPVIEGLIARGGDVHYHDDYVPTLELGTHGDGPSMSSTPLDYDTLGEYDCVVIVTDHGYFDAARLVAQARRVVDTRNLTGRAGVVDAKVVKL
ncbi:MAG: nucleotide sugar dehydrogenase, partial [Myxococcales bacterium]|nr:nucleotide sugar dehydrogenase [Myxococcales bacterium]